MRAKRSIDANGKEVLGFKAGDNWWNVEPVTGPDWVLEIYGKQLALDFLEYHGRQLEPDEHEKDLALILESMPANKGTVELAFIAEIQNMAQWMANAT